MTTIRIDDKNFLHLIKTTSRKHNCTMERAVKLLISKKKSDAERILEHIEELNTIIQTSSLEEDDKISLQMFTYKIQDLYKTLLSNPTTINSINKELTLIMETIQGAET